ncbi:MAG: gliding motility-associated C-terminal domain-containing protein [Bacteroidales bacterium]|jgi:gliding motility-associated-like protein|nr:gliding motility-associated C-terminal domain-containing protein [Bacteroidales bacterium]
MTKWVFTGILVFFLSFSVYGTHERAGEITYRHLGGLSYEVTITTYTYPNPADRPELTIKWGDGNEEKVPRRIKQSLGNNIQRNTYVAQHTFPATGTYILSMEDPNRNEGIINVPNSVNIPFYIESTLIINPFFQYNNSPVLTNPPVDVGCVDVPFYHNPGAADPDGDSLVYSLILCRGYDGENIPGYSYPITSNTVSINPLTGDFYWDSPVLQGEYNIAILIEEYRLGVKVGSVVRDMQILITSCNNHPPVITAINDTCVNAGDTLQFQVSAYDDTVILTAYGDVFSAAHNPAIFPQTVGAGVATGIFSWNTHCLHVRKQPYQVTFKANDNHRNVPLTSIKTVRITVVAPAPQNLQAVPFENTITLSWNPSPCNNAIGYKIYRRINSYGFIPDHCETGVPAYTGYTQIGTTDINTTSFLDNNDGKGLARGTVYCYLVIAYFADMAESYASNEACVTLKKEVPVITHISILETGATSGKVYVQWTKPTEFDTVQYPGPYYYTINRSINNAYNFTVVATYLSLDSLVFIDSLQNTENNTFFYRINVYNNTVNPYLIGSSDMASSVFLFLEPADRQLKISWNVSVPWENYNYIVYRENNGVFDSVGQTHLTSFTDTNLTNGQSYCYYIEAQGAYSDATLPNPLINLSQISCAQPIDNMPPCVPYLQGNTDCKSIYMQWTFPDTCNMSDASKTYIYYRSDLSSDYSLLDSIPYPNTSHTLNNLPSIVGCFLLTVTDTNGNTSNYSNELCFDIDMCNAYRLPNVFTPNGDGIDDFFMPFQYDFVESISMYIYNRWGGLIFKTTNPDILWDGTNQFTKQVCVEGVYYYVCDVKEYTLNGVKTRRLNGSITIFR